MKWISPGEATDHLGLSMDGFRYFMKHIAPTVTEGGRLRTSKLRYGNNRRTLFYAADDIEALKQRLNALRRNPAPEGHLPISEVARQLKLRKHSVYKLAKSLKFRIVYGPGVDRRGRVHRRCSYVPAAIIEEARTRSQETREVGGRIWITPAEAMRRFGMSPPGFYAYVKQVAPAWNNGQGFSRCQFRARRGKMVWHLAADEIDAAIHRKRIHPAAPLVDGHIPIAEAARRAGRTKSSIYNRIRRLELPIVPVTGKDKRGRTHRRRAYVPTAILEVAPDPKAIRENGRFRGRKSYWVSTREGKHVEHAAVSGVPKPLTPMPGVAFASPQIKPNAITESTPIDSNELKLSPPMSKAELARRILNRAKAKARDIDWARFDWQKWQGSKILGTISLARCDQRMIDRIEAENFTPN